VYVATARRERTPETFARIITSAALGTAQREADARADHTARLSSPQAPDSPTWLPTGEEAGHA